MKESQAEVSTKMLNERQAEQLRQERETFNQHKAQEKLWFWLQFLGGILAPIRFS